MTTPFVRYVIVANAEDDPEATRIFNWLPAKLNKVMITTAQYGALRDEGDKYVRFIFVNPTQSSFNVPSGLDNVDLSGLKVDTAVQPNSVQFLVKSDTGLITSGPVHNYLEPEVLFGAIFSDKAEDYECLMQRAYLRMNIVASIYDVKLAEMAPLFYATNCESFYINNAGTEAIMVATATYPPDYAGIGLAKSKLKEDNERLQLYSCPLIY
ncbi:TPA: hypothetical protein HA265_07150 [Candidatus Woesearchaeota archaeon]|nr:hypothetical protein [Candidatus Woesearchaeota archaeon]